MTIKIVTTALLSAVALTNLVIPPVSSTAAVNIPSSITSTKASVIALFSAEATVVMYESATGIEHEFTIECTLPLTKTGPFVHGNYKYYVYTDAHGAIFSGLNYIP